MNNKQFTDEEVMALREIVEGYDNAWQQVRKDSREFNLPEFEMSFTGALACKLYDGKPPEYATTGSAGLDLRYVGEKPMVIKPGEQVLVPTGIRIHIRNCFFVGQLYIRSGIALKHRIRLGNGCGIIDSDYTKEIGACLVSGNREDFTIKPGERICQLLIVPVAKAQLKVVHSLDKTDRKGGFGSTGTE